MVYFISYINGWYNPLYTLKNQFFFHSQISGMLPNPMIFAAKSKSRLMIPMGKWIAKFGESDILVFRQKNRHAQKKQSKFNL